MSGQPRDDDRRWSAHFDQVEAFVDQVEAELAGVDGDQVSARLDDLLREGGWYTDEIPARSWDGMGF